MTGRAVRASGLTTVELHLLDQACGLLQRGFGTTNLYLVGSAGVGGEGTHRDVDVRMMLSDEVFAAVCPTRDRWEALCLAFSVYLSQRTGLPVDFQIQQQSAANAAHDGPRNPIGRGRVFAGGGDGVPPWQVS